ncbi:TipJ family phage tail tip protein [Azospirillum canadense]|uniref:TipJ family phage tail tip protein n=1 Tax=Azospirillum canadense TaxID=403962 RepID=UPI00222721BB|nr:phage tail protein [Azospirillum canadense]MCW2242273.1 putative phage tail protein [Azospirillum canadense]
MTEMNLRGILGAGGGKSGGSSGAGAVEDPNNLQSNTIARFLDVIAEGEIGGLVDGAKSIYINGTPLQASDGTYNFAGVSWQSRNGTTWQAPVAGFSDVEHEVNLNNRKITVAGSPGPLITTIENGTIDRLRVTMAVDALTQQDTSNGNLHGAAVQYAIDTRPEGGAWTEVLNDTISGKTTSTFPKAVYVSKPAGATGRWDFRVRRLTPDSTTVTLRNDLYVVSYTEITDSWLVYPDTALMAVEIDAKQFGSSIPDRTYEVWGRKIRVPANYDPVARTYAISGPGTSGGIWDGSFKLAVTDNPAWVLYDLLTDERAGLGAVFGGLAPDKGSFYQIAKYCDASIPDGFGGTEPRFRCSCVLNTREEAYKVLQSIASSFRGMLYWASGTVYAAADMPADPAKLVTPANVIDGLISYEGTALKARHSVVAVTWYDPADGYKPAVELVEDPELIALYGWRQADVTAYGCTSRGQARRQGLWVLNSERYETETATWTAALDHADVKPGDIVEIRDPVRAGVRFGGRLAGVTDAHRVTLDAPVDLAAGHSYQLSVMLPTGAVESRPVVTDGQAKTLLTLDLDTPYSMTPEVGKVWALVGTDVSSSLWRVVANQQSEAHLYKITALKHDSTKYARIELGLKIDPLAYTRLTTGDAVPAPQNVTVTKQTYSVPGGLRTRFLLSWSPPNSAIVSAYQVQYETPSGLWVDAGKIVTVSYEINDLEIGSYRFRVRSLTKDNRGSSWVMASSTVAATDEEFAAPPQTPTQLTLNTSVYEDERAGTTLVALGAAWVPGFDSDIKHFEVAHKRTSDTEWTVDRTTDTVKTWWVDAGTEYHVKVRAVDLLDQPSAYTADAVITSAIPLTKPSAPALSDATLNEHNLGETTVRRKVDVHWAANPVEERVSSYIVMVGSAALQGGFEMPATGTSYSYEWTGSRGPGYTHVRVRAVNVKGQKSDWSAWFPLTVVADTTPPADPTGLTASPGLRLLNWSWTNPTDDDFAGVEVYVSATSARPATPVTTTFLSQYTITDLPANARRYLWLRAKDASDNFGNFVGPAAVTTGAIVAGDFDAGAPATPTGLALAQNNAPLADGTLSTRLNITWTANSESDLDGYELEVREGLTAGWPGNAATPTGIPAGNTTAYALTVRAGFTYGVKIRAKDFLGQTSGWSAEVVLGVTGDAVGPAKPTGVQTTALFQAIRVDWVNPSDADFDQVRVWANTSSDAATKTLVWEGHASSFTHEVNTAGATRYYWLEALDISGNPSGFTGPYSATTATLSAGSFASDAQPVKTVTANPLAAGNLNNGSLGGGATTISYGGRLYTWDGAKWVDAVSASNLSGQIGDGQISGVSTGKLSGTIADNQIAGLSAAKVTGDLTNAQINVSKLQGQIANSQLGTGIDAAKLSGDITNATMAAGKITGQITQTQITDGAISTPKLAAGSVVASKLAVVPNNLCPDPLFLDQSFWTPDAGGWFFEKTTNANELGTFSYVVLWDGSYTGSARRHVWSPALPYAGANRTLRFRARGAVTNTTQTVYAGVQCWDNANNFLAMTSVSWGASPAGTGVSVQESTIVVPANTALLKLVVFQDGTAPWKGVAKVSEVELCEAATASMIVDGAVVAGKIATNAVTAGTVAAGVISAREIQTGAITASKIGVTDLTNLVPNNLFDDNAAGWYRASGQPVSLLTTWGADWGPNGALRVEPNEWHYSPRFEVEPLREYYVSSYITTNNTGLVDLFIDFLDKNGGFLSNAQLITSKPFPDNSTISGSFTVPANTFYARVCYRKSVNYMAVGHPTVRMKNNGSLIVDGTIQSNHVASQAITTSKLLVASTGAALNADPSLLDISAWQYWDGGSAQALFTMVSDGAAGNNVVRSLGGHVNGTWMYARQRIAVDPTKSYRVRCLARRSSDATGLFYMGVAAFDFQGNNLDSGGNGGRGGSQWFYAASAVTPGTGWTTYVGRFGAGTDLPIPSNVKTISPLFILNYGSGAAGYMEVQDLRLEECVPGSLIVDGAITGDKVAANAISARHIVISDAENLIPDNAFLDANSWVYAGTWAGPAAGRVGLAAVSGWRTAYGYEFRSYEGNICSQPFTMIPGDQYRFGFQGWSNSSDISIEMWVHNEETDYWYRLGFWYPNGSLVDYAFTWTAPSDLRRARFHLIRRGGTSATNVWATVAAPYCRRLNGGELIVDGAVTANKIGALAVTGDKVAAGTLTVDKLAVFSTGNLMAGADLSAGKTYWNLSWNQNNNPHDFGQDGPDANWYPVGGHSLFVHQTSGGAGIIDYKYMHPSVGGLSERVPVEPGKYVEFSFYALAHRCSVVALLIFDDANGNYITEIPSAPCTTPGTNGKQLSLWVRLWVKAQVPSNAATVRLIMRKSGTDAGQSDSWAFWTHPFYGYCGANATEPQPWQPGGSTAISGASLVTGSIVADKLAVNSVTANAIAAGAVTVDKLAANSITATKLALGDLTNLVPDNNLDEMSWGNWNANGSLTRVNATGDWRATRIFQVDMPGNDWCHVASGNFRVEPGKSYRISGMFQRNGSATGTATIYVDWLTWDGQWIYNAGNWDQSVGNTGPQEIAATLVAPANAAFARLLYRIGSTATGRWFFGGAIVKRLYGGELIVDGTITTNHMGANTINGDRITGGTIAGDKITAGTITGDRLALGFAKMDAIRVVGHSNNVTAGPTNGVYINNARRGENLTRGLNAWAFDRSTHAFIEFRSWDLYGNYSLAGDMMNWLNAQGSDRLIFIASYDAHRVADDGLLTALKRIGASSAAKTADANRYPYALIGWGGLGEGNGLEMRKDGNSTVPAEVSTLWCDSNVFGISTGSGPFTTIEPGRILVGGTNGLDGYFNGTTIDGGKLTANSVQGDRIIAGTMSGDRIAAGSLGVSALATFATANMLVNSDFAGGTWGWQYTGTNNGVPHNYGIDLPGWFPVGSHALYIEQLSGTSGGVFDAYYRHPNAAAGWPRLPIEPGQTYEFSAYTGNHRCSGNLYIAWYDSAGNGLGTTALTAACTNNAEAGGGQLLSGWKRLWVKGTAPSNAAYAEPVIRKNNTFSGQANSYMFVAYVFFGVCGINATGPQPWAPAGQTTILGDQISTGTLNANRIVAGTITGNLIGNAELGTLKLAGNAVTVPSAGYYPEEVWVGNVFTDNPAAWWYGSTADFVSDGSPVLLVGSFVARIDDGGSSTNNNCAGWIERVNWGDSNNITRITSQSIFLQNLAVGTSWPSNAGCFTAVAVDYPPAGMTVRYKIMAAKGKGAGSPNVWVSNRGIYHMACKR